MIISLLSRKLKLLNEAENFRKKKLDFGSAVW
jgi:hypothetical protein